MEAINDHEGTLVRAVHITNVALDSPVAGPFAKKNLVPWVQRAYAAKLACIQDLEAAGPPSLRAEKALVSTLQELAARAELHPSLLTPLATSAAASNYPQHVVLNQAAASASPHARLQLQSSKLHPPTSPVKSGVLDALRGVASALGLYSPLKLTRLPVKPIFDGRNQLIGYFMAFDKETNDMGWQAYNTNHHTCTETPFHSLSRENFNLFKQGVGKQAQFGKHASRIPHPKKHFGISHVPSQAWQEVVTGFTGKLHDLLAWVEFLRKAKQGLSDSEAKTLDLVEEFVVTTRPHMRDGRIESVFSQQGLQEIITGSMAALQSHARLDARSRIALGTGKVQHPTPDAPHQPRSSSLGSPVACTLPGSF